ncbi:hypothetical protein ZOD2009_09680 [Haladaptatus paucihalophilus DX253]|uniref:Uncharacterized protein n=1 Tax=Haladaptatus paucihalophilus DX253 TaxID=797209 RepID=E7QT36_HALPU|nr:hypothetical protein ZOD2009_09680 [Haladaptatus paucihalophilus DX253]
MHAFVNASTDCVGEIGAAVLCAKLAGPLNVIDLSISHTVPADDCVIVY